MKCWPRERERRERAERASALWRLHRTVGPHRAWCHECHEWCYPRIAAGCRGCLMPEMRRLLLAATLAFDYMLMSIPQSHRPNEYPDWYKQAKEIL